MALIEIKKDRCKKCYACVRICPVQAIRVNAQTDFPEVNDDRCIGCGSCVTICHPGAVVFEDAREATKTLLQKNQQVAAIVEPSIAGEFSDITDYRKFVEMIRRLGFTYVCESSFGVDLIAQKYSQLFANNKGKYYITANCPSVCFYIEKFHPELIENLAPIAPPMIASAKVVRKRYGADIPIVYIGPCIAYKKIITRYTNTDGQIDTVLTFRELRQLFAEFSIKESTLEFSEFDPPFGNKGSLYPISNGLLQAADISEDLLQGTVVTTEGRDNMLHAVKEFAKHTPIINRHLNLFYDEGCLMGPGTSPGGERFLRRTLVINYAQKRIDKISRRDWAKDLKYFLSMDFSATFANNDQRLPTPSETKINEVLRTLGKGSLNESPGCGSCGYASCAQFAESVAQGLTSTDMCIHYSSQNRKEYIKEINMLRNQLNNAQQALDESQHATLREQEQSVEAKQTIDTMLQKLPISLVIVDEKLHIVQASHSLIRLLGAEAEDINEVIPGLVGADLKSLIPYSVFNLFSYVFQNGEDIPNRDIHLGNGELYNISVFTIKKGKTVGAVIRDMHSPEIRKEEVVKRINEVIDKNLEMVQKMGFLLGEGAAETEKMLNSIIEVYKGKSDEVMK
jgi:Na+-translocating ferredoxin:NAD+ oxidoreductase RNF subunit RnfB